MKGFVLILVVVLLAYTCAAPHNYGSVTGGNDSFVTGELSNSNIGSDSLPKPGNSLPKGNGAFSPGDAQRESVASGGPVSNASNGSGPFTDPGDAKRPCNFFQSLFMGC
ncbi:uncharacterized protein LOC135117357 [Helicoverpa armigera]|uniref:uncharacterized protein LOC135117357 n=1 Tax=Helicoverpa armigera TaxID=29058 RepID=UPI003082E6BD